jgi:hypothetical protein
VFGVRDLTGGNISFSEVARAVLEASGSPGADNTNSINSMTYQKWGRPNQAPSPRATKIIKAAAITISQNWRGFSPLIN